MQFDRLKRREFISLLGGAAVGWPLSARAQQPDNRPTIGFLGTATASAWRPYVAAFEQRLRELGWVDGRTVAIEYRWAEGHSERFSGFAAEFVRLKVDVILTSGTAIPKVREATSVIPIVFAVANDPLGTGMVASLARPGANVTGLSLQTPELAGKRLELLREVVPRLSRFAILGDVSSAASVLEIAQVQTAARGLGMEAATAEVRRAEDIAPVFETFKDRAEALFICGANPLVSSNVALINTLALAARLPTMHGTKEYLTEGGLMSYGPNNADLFRRAADYVDKILRGAKPGDLPVEQPTKFELVINLKTAKTLGLTVPVIMQMTADEVIE
jgi:putative tryptophan/tyrosine transport system substrate-binding protein